MTVEEPTITREEAVLRCLFGPKRTGNGADDGHGSKDDLRQKDEELSACVVRLLDKYGETEVGATSLSIPDFEDLLRKRYGQIGNRDG